MELTANTQEGIRSSVPRRTVASFPRYEDAQRAVDFLADRRFPVERVAIVAEGLRLVEQVTGRLSYGRVAGNGALSGALVGGLFGFIFGLFNWVAPLVSAFRLTLYGLIYGAVVGALMNVVFYAFTAGKRDFASVGTINADRYNVVVDADAADEALRLLSTMYGARTASPHAPQPA